MVDDGVLAAAAEVLQSLAAKTAVAHSTIPPTSWSDFKLPGRDTPAKRDFEMQLARLALRIEALETRAHSAATFPETPNEACDSSYEFGAEVGTPPSTGSRPSCASKLPGSRKGSLDDPHHLAGQLTENALEGLQGLQEHVRDQSKLIDSQRQELDGIDAQLYEQKQLTEKALAVIEQERVARLERELWKHQKANEAFQKALREIGEIVTAVARGDLSKKVRMNSVEMDPEITLFKKTINTMMDQLQVFASEVSRVAREVGTEGLLGGQARIDGVDGTWKELTDNGMVSTL